MTTKKSIDPFVIGAEMRVLPDAVKIRGRPPKG